MNHFAVQQKLTHCKSTILQLKKTKLCVFTLEINMERIFTNPGESIKEIK